MREVTPSVRSECHVMTLRGARAPPPRARDLLGGLEVSTAALVADPEGDALGEPLVRVLPQDGGPGRRREGGGLGG